LSDKIDSNAQHEASERKALILQLENELLKATGKARALKGWKKSSRSKKVGKKK